MNDIHPVLRHAGFWALYIGLELAYLLTGPRHADPWFFYVIYYALNLGLFYGLVWLLQRGWRSALPGVPLLLLLFLSAKFLAAHFLSAPPFSFAAQFQALGLFLVGALFRSLSFGMMAVLYWLATRQARVERELAEARTAYLQQRVQPHLLFNALNFIYTHIYRHSEAGARAVHLLAELMRYSLEGAGPDGRVPLTAELAQVDQLIELNGCRFNEPLQIRDERSGLQPEQRIPPLILLTLVENIFKHGEFLDPAEPVILRLQAVEGMLHFYARNRKCAPRSARQTTALGLVNTRTRLEVLYPGRYTLRIHEDTDYFTLSLSLPL